MPKSTKDPTRPKRPMTGFMFFSKHRRTTVAQENPDLGFKDIGRKMGEIWRGLSDEEKAPYDEMAAQDKARYQEEIKHWVPDPAYPKKKKRRDPNKPKRAITAYLYFCKAHRNSVVAEFPEKSMVEIQKVLGERWQATSEAERAPFLNQAHADRERYDREMLELAQKSKNDEEEEEEDDEEEDGDGY